MPNTNESTLSTTALSVPSTSALSQLFRDFHKSLKFSARWLYATWFETLLAYRSTTLGPLWSIVGMFFFVFAIGGLFRHVMLTGGGGSNVYLVHLAVGYALYQFVSQIVNDSARMFYNNRSAILDGQILYTDLVLKNVTQNAIDFLHTLPVLILTFVYCRALPPIESLLLILTIPIVVLNVLWGSVIVSILGARYSDIYELIRSTLRLMFFVTPVLWVAHEDVRGPFIDAFLYVNPFYYVLEVIRAPLVTGEIPYLEIAVLIVALPFGWFAASWLYARTKPWIPLWL